jgi:hypothetical protein
MFTNTERGLWYTNTKPGFIFVCTQKGYDKTPDPVKHERAPGRPIKGFAYSVPNSWLEKGYVEVISER